MSICTDLYCVIYMYEIATVVPKTVYKGVGKKLVVTDATFMLLK